MERYTHLKNLLAEVSDVPDDSILSRTVHDDHQLRVVMFNFAAGQDLSEHTSKSAAVLLFLNGEAEVTLGDDALEATTGTFVHMTPHLPHSIVAKSPTTMLLMMLKSQA
jgi:quercetin dioxygenase-like cupin family protein